MYGYSEFVYDPLPVPGYSLDGLDLTMPKSAIGEVFEKFKADTLGKDVALGERAFGDKFYTATVSDFGCDFIVGEEVEKIELPP